MSVLVHVRQFFNADGLKAFPTLFEEHRRMASAIAGFISLERSGSGETERSNEIELTLEFESEALLKQWRASPQHEQVAAGYRRFWTREPETVFYSAEI